MGYDNDKNIYDLAVTKSLYYSELAKYYLLAGLEDSYKEIEEKNSELKKLIANTSEDTLDFDSQQALVLLAEIFKVCESCEAVHKGDGDGDTDGSENTGFNYTLNFNF